MEGIKNYTVMFYSSDPEYPESKNVTAEQALQIMKAKDMDKKNLIIDGEMFASHQVFRVYRNMEAERDECYGKQLSLQDRKMLDVRNLKHGVPKLAEFTKKIIQ